MPLHYEALILMRRTVVFFFVACSLLLGIVLDIYAVAASVDNESINESVSMLQVSDRVITDYTTIVSDFAVSKQMIVLNGTVKSLVKLPQESIVVMLPENRLALSSAEEISILPEGSTVSYYNEKPIVYLPQQSEVLSVSAVVESPLQNFTMKTNFIQSIQELDAYNVQVVFFELVREHVDVPLVQYHIDWGDGSNGTFTVDTITVAHEYDKSGEYQFMLNVTDGLGFSFVTSQRLTVNYEGHLTHSYLWINKNKAPVALISASFGVLALGLVVFTESGRYKLLVLLTVLLPFFSRIQKEDVLDQFVRGQIYGYIKTNPGVHYNQILRKVGVKNGTLSYHLAVLEKTELIQSRREGLKYRVFYPTGMTFPKEERFRLTQLQIRLLECIKNQPGLTQKELAQVLGRKPQTINYNIKVLDQAGLVLVEKRGRKTMCLPVENGTQMAVGQ